MSEKMDTTPTIDMVIAEFETAISEGMAMMDGPSGGAGEVGDGGWVLKSQGVCKLQLYRKSGS